MAHSRTEWRLKHTGQVAHLPQDYSLKTALAIILASKPTLRLYKDYMKEINEMFDERYRIGAPDFWKELGLTKEQAQEYFDAVISGTVENWAKKYNCIWE